MLKRIEQAKHLMYCCCLLALVLATLGVEAANLRRHRKLIRADPQKRIDGRYIVVLKDHEHSVDQRIRRLLNDRSGKVHQAYHSAVKGFAVSDISEEHLQQVLDSEEVAYCEEDQVFSIATDQNDPENWGLDRIDQKTSLNQIYRYEFTGAGVDTYILDTGIRSTHEEFSGRVICGKNVYNDTAGCEDDNGHGTHVAGVVGGLQYGVAKAVSLIAVKVIEEDGKGRNSDLVAGLDYVLTQRQTKPGARMVATLSHNGIPSLALNRAVNTTVSSGVFIASAAGNDGRSACLTSPGNARAAMTVGATTINDMRASFSNHGYCVDIFAPGEAITSAWYGQDNAKATLSGTSISSAFVAGVAALVFNFNPSFGPSDVSFFMKNHSSLGVLSKTGLFSPNSLLNTQALQRN